MTNPMTDIDIPFNKLIDHPGNVRAQSTETYDPENLGDLVASIEELGLINRLVVQKIGDNYGVLAGARRRGAIKLLVARKDCKAFTAKTKIGCREIAEDCDVTTALSLAENVTQLPMTAIDQYEAYAKMFDTEGKSIEDIAKTFGITEANVKARLRIGGQFGPGVGVMTDQIGHHTGRVGRRVAQRPTGDGPHVLFKLVAAATIQPGLFGYPPVPTRCYTRRNGARQVCEGLSHPDG